MDCSGGFSAGASLITDEAIPCGWPRRWPQCGLRRSVFGTRIGRTSDRPEVTDFFNTAGPTSLHVGSRFTFRGQDVTHTTYIVVTSVRIASFLGLLVGPVPLSTTPVSLCILTTKNGEKKQITPQPCNQMHYRLPDRGQAQTRTL
jgi:hypothetical protein